MSKDSEKTSCPQCGAQVSTGGGECPQCGTSFKNDWEREKARLKKLWVIVTLFFWFSLIFQGTLYILDGTLNLVLLSVISGMMVLGIVLKLKLQWHLRKKPSD